MGNGKSLAQAETKVKTTMKNEIFDPYYALEVLKKADQELEKRLQDFIKELRSGINRRMEIGHLHYTHYSYYHPQQIGHLHYTHYSYYHPQQIGGAALDQIVSELQQKGYKASWFTDKPNYGRYSYTIKWDHKLFKENLKYYNCFLLKPTDTNVTDTELDSL